MLWKTEKVINRAAKHSHAAIFARELLLSENFGFRSDCEVGKVREVRVAVIVSKLLARFFFIFFFYFDWEWFSSMNELWKSEFSFQVLPALRILWHK